MDASYGVNNILLVIYTLYMFGNARYIETMLYILQQLLVAVNKKYNRFTRIHKYLLTFVFNDYKPEIEGGKGGRHSRSVPDELEFKIPFKVNNWYNVQIGIEYVFFYFSSSVASEGRPSSCRN